LAFKAACVLIFSLLLISCDLLSPGTDQAPIICFTFDDQHISIWQHAFSILDQYGFKGTNFINSGRIGQPELMDWDQLLTLELEHGWETGGHTLYHEDLPSLSFAEAEIAIGQDYHNIRDKGLSPKGFALPGGSCPVEYYEIIDRYYDYIRCSSDFAMQRPVNRRALGYLSFQSGWTADQIKDRIKRGIARGEALIIIGFHRIETPEGGYNDNCPATELEEIMRFVSGKGLRVMTLSEALEQL